MKVVRGSSPGKMVKRRWKQNPRASSAARLRATASVLGHLGLMAHSMLTGNVADWGIRQIASGELVNGLLGALAIAVSLLSTMTGLGVIFLPQRTALALRLMVLGGLSSLAVGSWLWAAGRPLLLLTSLAAACLWLGAIATLRLHRLRWRSRVQPRKHRRCEPRTDGRRKV